MESERRSTIFIPVDEAKEKILDILSAQSAQLASLEELMVKFATAIPGGDAEGHRMYHELVIKREQKKLARTEAIIEKSLAGLVWSGLVAVGSAIWYYIQHKLVGGN